MTEGQWDRDQAVLNDHPHDNLAADLLKQVLAADPHASDILLRFEEEGRPRFYIDGEDVTPPHAPPDPVEPEGPEPNGQCVGCGRGTNGWFPEGGTHGPGWYCGWCDAVPA